MENLNAVMQQFAVEGNLVSVEPYGEGHINATYLAITDKEKYILQLINNGVFHDVKGLMENIVSVTEYIKAKATDKDPKKESLTVIPTINGKSFYVSPERQFYRLYVFIDNAVSLQVVDNPHLFYLSGIGFGKFQRYLDGFPAETLHESIVNFHNTRDRFNKFLDAIEKDVVGRVAGVRTEIEFYKDREAYCDIVLDALKDNKIPYRVTHNDTKLNNVMIDVANDMPLAVIDLDTVMPGSILYDFGDSIRSGANTGLEDEIDLTKVNFSLEYYEAYAKGFIQEVASALTDKEVELMAFGAILMTYECGMRFLTDYLNGDTYFRIHREAHNLDRTRTQIKMVKDMESNLEIMNEIVKKTYNENKK